MCAMSLPGLMGFPVDSALCWEVVKPGCPHPSWAWGAGGWGSPGPAHLWAAQQHSRSKAVLEKETYTPKWTRQRGRDLRVCA